ncbi:uncharacterized protein LOC115875318 [Sitophilus oryzae]|uniref:Uncharacterized protein LOC115875318 n=1 Tax=Sitophilus oryzae TaxID=7048 RepID=A0A6J2X5Z7_SITOR|nr:uncharacterized protein LOC115875318 [Sitophilus oryzae]
MGRKEIQKIKDMHGNIVTHKQEILHSIKLFYQELYTSKPQGIKTDIRKVINQGSKEIPEITEEEIISALRDMKNKRAAGDDGLVIESIQEGGPEIIKALNVLFNKCIEEEITPSQWNNATIIIVHKKEYGKKFDSVLHQKLAEILRITGVDDGNLLIITQLYWNQTAEIRVDGGTSDEVEIRKGIRQGVYYPHSTSAPRRYSVRALRMVSKSIVPQLTIFASQMIRSYWLATFYTFRTCWTASVNMQYGLHINVNRTKLVFSKTPGKNVLRINNKVLEHVSSIKYLGALVNDACDPKTEILAKIEQAYFCFHKNLFQPREI